MAKEMKKRKRAASLLMFAMYLCVIRIDYAARNALKLDKETTLMEVRWTRVVLMK